MDPNKRSKLSRKGYPVISHCSISELSVKVVELSRILRHWDLFENNIDNPILNTPLKNARTGSSFGGPSPSLTLGQLFSVWRSGELIHTAYYDENNIEIHENLYQVGSGFSLSGSHIFYGIVPSRKTIVISDRAPANSGFHGLG